jgi:hypothetical protein
MPDIGEKKPPVESGWGIEKSRLKKFKIAGWRRPTDILRYMEMITPFIFFVTALNRGNGT